MLDEMDKRIVRLLQRNARVPNTEIARTLNVTETTVRNRVSRLLDEGLIEIVAVLDPKAVEANISAFLALTVHQSQAEQVAESLRERSEVRYVASVLARAQILVEAFFRDHEHLLAFHTGFLPTLTAVSSVETSIVLRVHKLSYEWEI
ncbi:MAG: transcriptional regulator, AsnC family [Frankiales bacterium]|jgi:Lrp/AsnC family transcriptional regulator for asnA, asnC and gidA|nr:transcriptional regulator, AsnC family [Frankiales bacterium]